MSTEATSTVPYGYSPCEMGICGDCEDLKFRQPVRIGSTEPPTEPPQPICLFARYVDGECERYKALRRRELCPHCGDEISGRQVAENDSIYWCDTCDVCLEGDFG